VLPQFLGNFRNRPIFVQALNLSIFCIFEIGDHKRKERCLQQINVDWHTFGDFETREFVSRGQRIKNLWVKIENLLTVKFWIMQKSTSFEGAKKCENEEIQ
jgi:hypothetical protein